MFEKDVMKMKTILSSEDLLELSPKDQLKHGQVCENSYVNFFQQKPVLWVRTRMNKFLVYDFEMSLLYIF